MSEDSRNQAMSELDSIIQKASEEILSKQDTGFCFSLKNTETKDYEDYSPVYENNEIAEFINVDMLGDEDENGETPFGHLTKGKKYEDITKDGGVLKILLDPGVGQVVPKDCIVLLHYIGYISNLLEPFDVTYLQGKKPKRFNLGSCELLPGLELGIQTMTHGENARFILSPKYAFREMGCPPRIPPNSTVIFDVHLVSYFAQDCLPLCFDDNDKDPNKFYINIALVKKLHYEGNQKFKRQKIDKAILKYEKAKEMMHLTGCPDEEAEIDMFKYLNKLYSNLSICYLKQCAFNKVCRMGSEAMKYSVRFSKNNAKLWFNWGKALRLLKDFSGGKKKLMKALNLEPQNITIQNELQHLEQDKIFYDRIIKLVTFEDVSTERLPSEFWDVFDTILKEFVDSSDDVLTVKLSNNNDDINLAENKSKLYDLQFQSLQYQGDNSFAIKKK